nr:cupin domain-containing protein [Polymorphobacter sp.]
MPPPLTCLLIAALAAAASPTLAAEPAAAFRTVTPEQLIWHPVPDSFGVESAVISGNPAQPGPYVIRVRFPPHVMDRPHSHSGDRHVTVIKGTWFAGTGPSFDPAKAVALKPGSYMFHPANGVHWDGANSDEEAIVQIIGTGPITSADVDPNLPSWVKVDR